MRGLFDVIGLVVICILGVKAWGLWQIQGAPSLEPQPVLSQKMADQGVSLPRDIQAVGCVRRASYFWEDEVRMLCTVEGPKTLGVALSVDTEIRVDPNEPTFDFEVRKTALNGELVVSAGIDKGEVFPSTATRMLRKRIQQVQDSLETPTGGKLRDARAAAERKQAVKNAWTSEP